MKNSKTAFVIITFSYLITFYSCSTTDENSSGHTYMDDMYQAPAIESDKAEINESSVALDKQSKMSEIDLQEGEKLYTIACASCHGANGSGDGLVVEKGGHARPNPYQNLNLEGILEVITNGKGVMGSHKSILDENERWQVANYVLHLQEQMK